MHDPKVDPRAGDRLKLRFYDFDYCDVEIVVEWPARFPDFIVGVSCPEKKPTYIPDNQPCVTRVELWAFREWAKNATVMHVEPEVENG